MRLFRPAAAITKKTPWTCSQCLHRWRASLFRQPKLHTFASKPNEVRFTKRHSIVVLATLSGTIGAGAVIALSEDLKHGYAAARRSGRVLMTLAVCMNE